MLTACNSNEPAKTEAMKPDSSSAATPAMRDINSPYPIGYSSKFVMDDPKNAETLLNLWKVWDGGDLSQAKGMFADSVEMHFSNGAMMHTTRDSTIAMGQKIRSSWTSSVSTVDAVMAVKSTDKNEHWALIWGKEIDKDKKGKVDSFYLQETWRFNGDGKADLMFQYRQAAAAPKMK